MTSDHASVAPSLGSRERSKKRARLKPLKRFLVIDATDGGGEVTLPNGVRGTIIASYHAPDLAFALAQGERSRGRQVSVADSSLLRKETIRGRSK